MMARIAWLATLVAIGVITAFLQLDRQSEATPALAALVPDPLRGYSQAQIAGRATEGDNAALALAETRRLVRRRPVPAESLTLLAVAQTKAGEPEQAGLTIQIAAQRGWREPLSQEAVLRLAVAAGDKPEAARRYAALFLRAATSNDLLRELAPAVLDETGGPGQQTLTDIVAGTDRWNDNFLRRGVQVMPAEAFTDIATVTIARGSRYNCAAMAQVIKALSQRDPAQADRLVQAATGQCPRLAR